MELLDEFNILFEKGKLEGLPDKLANETALSEFERYYIEGKYHGYTGSYEKASTFFSKITRDSLDPRYLVDMCIINGLCLQRQNKLKEGLDAIKLGEEVNNNISGQNMLLTLKLAQRKAAILFELGKYSEMENESINALFLSKDTEDNEVKMVRGQISYNLGMAYQTIGRLEDALAQLQISLKINRELGNNLGVAYNYMEMGGLQQSLGNLEKALDYFNQCHNLFKEYGTEKHLSWSMTDLGNICRLTGEISKSLDYYFKALPISEKIGENRTLANLYSVISKSFLAQGDFSKAMQYISQAKEQYSHASNEQFLGQTNLVMAQIHHDKGEFNVAEYEYREAISLFENNSAIIHEAQALYSLLKLYLENNLIERAETIKLRLKNLVVSRPEPIFPLLNNLGTALLFLQSDRDTIKSKGVELLEEIIDYENINTTYLIDAGIALLDFRFDNFVRLQTDIARTEFYDTLAQLENIGIEQNTPLIVIRSNLCAGKMKLLENDENSAQEYYSKSTKLAKEKGYFQFS